MAFCPLPCSTTCGHPERTNCEEDGAEHVVHNAAYALAWKHDYSTICTARRGAMRFGFDYPGGKRRDRRRRAAAGGATPCTLIKHPGREPGVTCNCMNKPPASFMCGIRRVHNKAHVLQAPLQCALQISTFPPSSTTALLGKPIYVAALVAAWCICANSFLRQAAMPLRPVTGTTVSRDKK